jgi:hypothetical protein
MSTSLNSGLPRRETCTHGPDSAPSSLLESMILTLRRLAALQTPITELASWRPLGLDRVAVKRSIGTCRAIVWMLKC